MANQEVIIQLSVNGGTIWQVKQPVPREHCRKMTGEELRAIGQAMSDVLAGVIATQKVASKISEGQATQETSRKKK